VVHMGIMEGLIMVVQVKEGFSTVFQFLLQLLEFVTMGIMDKEVCQTDMDTPMMEDHILWFMGQVL